MILSVLLLLAESQAMNFYNEGVLLGPAVRFDCVGPAVVCDLPSTYRARITVDVTVATINATGTPSAATYLRGDGTWATPGGSSPLTTKGDIYVYSTVDTRLPTSTDGLCLKTLASASTGLEWGACSSGGSGISYAEAVAAVLGGF